MQFKIANTTLETLQQKLDARHQNLIISASSMGKTDGIAGIPIVSATNLSASEQLIITEYQAEIEALLTLGRPELDDLHDNKYQAHKQALEELENNPHIITNEISNAQQNKADALDNLKDTHKNKKDSLHSRPDWVSVRNDFHQTNSALDTIASKVGRRIPLIQINRYVYGILIAALGICEFPLNFQVFKSFKSAPLDTIIMSGVLVIALPLMAHFSGMFLKQRKENPDYRWYLIIAVALMFLLSGITSYLRMQYLTQYQNTPIGEAYTDMYAFFTIGIVLYFVGTMASFFAHDESHALEVAYKHYKDSEKKHDKLKTQIHTSIAGLDTETQVKKDKINSDFLEKEKKINNQKKDLREKMVAAAGEHDQVLNHFKGLESQINQKSKTAIFKYQRENELHRSDKKTKPTYFGNAIPDLNLEFKNLSELAPNPIKDDDAVEFIKDIPPPVLNPFETF